MLGITAIFNPSRSQIPLLYSTSILAHTVSHQRGGKGFPERPKTRRRRANTRARLTQGLQQQTLLRTKPDIRAKLYSKVLTKTLTVGLESCICAHKQSDFADPSSSTGPWFCGESLHFSFFSMVLSRPRLIMLHSPNPCRLVSRERDLHNLTLPSRTRPRLNNH